MISLKGSRFASIMPGNLSSQLEVKAIAYAVGRQIEKLCTYADNARTYAAIWSMPEQTLDVLAVELRTPAYDEKYSVNVKRGLIEGTLTFYMQMGTPAAVNKIIRTIFEAGYIEEWYEYAGEPYHFRVILDTTHSSTPVSYAAVKKAIDTCKRLTAHMESLIYQCQIGLVIKTDTDCFRYRSAMTGKILAGTQPKRSTRAGITHSNLEIEAGRSKFGYHAPVAGTRPYRSTGAGLHSGTLEPAVTAEGITYKVIRCGTSRCKS